MTIPRHAYEGGIKYGFESEQGTPVAAATQIPGTIADLDYDLEQQFHEAFGPGNENLQSQTSMAYRYPLRIDFQPLDGGGGQFIKDYCLRSDADGSISSLTFELATSRIDSVSDLLAGCACNRLRLSCAQRGVLAASTDWIGMHWLEGGGISWVRPNNRPYVWAKALWSDSRQSSHVYPISLDLTVEHNLNEVYAMRASLLGNAQDYEPSHLFPGYTNIRAEVRALSRIDLVDVDDITVVYQFTGATSTFTITLTNGSYRGARRRIPANDLIEFGIPMTFRTISMTET